MITDNVSIKVVNSPSDAPKYEKEVLMLQIKTVIVVGRGTVNNNPTVDLQLEDANGKKYLVMATGGIMEGIGAAVTGKRIATQGH